jgi:threonyl-tRNA synthetase
LSEKYENYAKKVSELLENSEIRTLVDNRNETIGKKIRDAEGQKYPFMLIIGEEEEKNGTVSVRRHGQDGKGNITVSIDDFASIVKEEVQKTLKTFEV